jgi:hypothetical protein
MGKWYSVALMLMALMFADSALAAPVSYSRRQLPAARVSAPPVIDGKLDDACWAALPVATDFTDSVLGTPVADQTTVRIGYDDRCIYVAFQCKDSHGRAIVARETRRAASFWDEDQVSVIVNPFHSGRSEEESTFTVNALGTQNAAVAGGRATKHEWEGVWQSAGRIVEDGWVAEMAIPWRIVTRPSGSGGKVTIGLNFSRYQPRTQVASWWSNLGTQYRHELSGEWVGVVMPPAAHTKQLEALAYALGGYEYHGAAGRLGADARYHLTPQLTALATVNPDFSDIEGAVTRIDFSYSELLPYETRPFFLEGANYYADGGVGYKPFASVRIPDFDLGGKFFGRVAPGTDVAVLADGTVGSRTDGVARVRHDFSPYDSLNATVVSASSPGIDNTVGMLGGSTRRGDWKLSGSLSRSLDRSGNGERAGCAVDWGDKHWSASAYNLWVSRLFTARDGYVAFQDDKELSVSGSYGATWRKGPLTWISFGAGSYHDTHYDGSYFQRGTSVYARFETRKQLYINASYSTGRFEDNHDHVWSLYTVYPAENRLCYCGISYRWGRQGGFDYYDLNPFIRWRIRNRLALEGSSEIVHTDGTHTQEVVSVSYDLSRRESVGGRLIERDGRVTWYASFRHSGYAGTEYYVILGDPNSPRFTERLMVKVVQPL